MARGRTASGGGSNIPCVCAPVFPDCGPIYDYTDPACASPHPDEYDYPDDPNYSYRCLCDSLAGGTSYIYPNYDYCESVCGSVKPDKTRKSGASFKRGGRVRRQQGGNDNNLPKPWNR
jgi:hypothetical protein